MLSPSQNLNIGPTTIIPSGNPKANRSNIDECTSLSNMYINQHLRYGLLFVFNVETAGTPLYRRELDAAGMTEKSVKFTLARSGVS